MLIGESCHSTAHFSCVFMFLLVTIFHLHLLFHVSHFTFPHFHVSHFPPLKFGAAFSCLTFFTTCIFDGVTFFCLEFSVASKSMDVCYDQVEFERAKTKEADSSSASPDSPSKIIKRVLFGHMHPYPQKKVITFNKHVSDFSFDVSYGDLDFLSVGELR